MRLPFLLPILHLTWTVQAHIGLEPTHLPRDIVPGHLLNFRSSSVGKTLLARDLTPVETYVSSTLVKRVTPSGSPQRGRSPVRTSSGSVQQGTSSEMTPAGPSQQRTSSERTPAGPSQRGRSLDRSPAGPSQRERSPAMTPSGSPQRGRSLDRAYLLTPSPGTPPERIAQEAPVRAEARERASRRLPTGLQRDEQGQRLHLQNVGRRVAAGVIGLSTVGAVTALAGSTEWNNPGQAVPVALGAACIGVAALTAACAHKALQHLAVPGAEVSDLLQGRRADPGRRQANSAEQQAMLAAPRRRPEQEIELQTVPPLQGVRPPYPPRSSDPADLVRR